MLTYEGHDEPQRQGGLNPKEVDQPLTTSRGSCDGEWEILSRRYGFQKRPGREAGAHQSLRKDFARKSCAPDCGRAERLTSGSARSVSPARTIAWHRFVLTSASADHPFCSGAFCSPRFHRRGFALPRFALPRRYRSTTRPALGRYHEFVGDQFLRCPFSLLHLPDLLLARADSAIRPDRYGRWSRTRLARSDVDPVGKPSGGIVLHSEPLARPSSHAGNRSSSCLRLVVHHAPQCSRPATLAFVGFRDPTF